MFRKPARSLRAACLVGLWCLGLLLLAVLVQAQLWIVALLALPALPAMWELWRNSVSGIEISQGRIVWFTASGCDEVALSEIDKVVMDTRWDFSVRVTLVMEPGRKLRLPPPALPPHRLLETELSRRGLRVVRNHFNVF